jgi:hypothetical protein
MPIPFEQKVIAVLFSLTLLLVTLQLIRKHKLREQYAFVWFGVSLMIFLFSVFDGLVVGLASLVAVAYAPTLILVMGLLFCLVILVSQTVLLSSQADKIRDLAQTVGLLEHRIGQLEQQKPAKSPTIARLPIVSSELPKVTLHGKQS